MTIDPEYIKMDLLLKNRQLMNRTRGFVNLNRFKHGKTIKRLSKVTYKKRQKIRGERSQGKEH